MARHRRYPPLNVYLNTRHVGKLSRDASGAISFQYVREWIDFQQNLPVSLSLPIREQAYTGAEVVAVFDNLLPDNAELRRRVAARTRAEGPDAFSLLSAIGHDCVGALQFLPPGEQPTPIGTLEASPINRSKIAKIIENLAKAPLGITEDDSFRISIAGAQEKTALLLLNGKWFQPHGTTATTHILKPSIGRLPNGMDLTDSVENEYLCLKILAALGLPVAEADIATFGKRRVLVVQRFDRHWTRRNTLLRLPQEDCCQALSVLSTKKYQSEGGPGIVGILRLLQGGDEPAIDQVTFLKANIAFWLLGAIDGHAKNFSIFLSPGGRFHLTPLYDVVSAQPSLDSKQLPWKSFRLAMAFGSKPHYLVRQITSRHIVATAKQAGVGDPVIQAVLEDICKNASHALDSVLKALPKSFPGRTASSITAGFRRRLQRLSDS